VSEASALLELQGVDLEIMRAEKRLDELPEKRAILECRVRQREAAVLRGKADTLLRKLQAEVKARQDEIATVQEKIATEQKKLMETADHRQVQAISREMDGLKRRVDKLEMEELQFMERAEKASAQVETVDAHIAKLAEKEQQLIAEFKRVGGSVQAELGELEARRKKLVKQVGEPLFKKYEESRESHAGIGVGLLEDASCSACRMVLPAERRAELIAGPDVGMCPTCRRLIVVRVDSA
jgi:predicted  nucleic acid-binding Zn-ribbon protein